MVLVAAMLVSNSLQPVMRMNSRSRLPLLSQIAQNDMVEAASSSPKADLINDEGI